MEQTHLAFDHSFEVTMETDEAQAAEMTIEPGRTVGGPDNVHPNSDQWLFVANGTGTLTVDGTTYRIDTGDLIRIDSGERHSIENDGEGPLETVNFYAPPRSI